MRLDGTITHVSERHSRVQKFQEDESYSVFLLTTQVWIQNTALFSPFAWRRCILFSILWRIVPVKSKEERQWTSWGPFQAGLLSTQCSLFKDYFRQYMPYFELQLWNITYANFTSDTLNEGQEKKWPNIAWQLFLLLHVSSEIYNQYSKGVSVSRCPVMIFWCDVLQVGGVGLTLTGADRVIICKQLFLCFSHILSDDTFLWHHFKKLSLVIVSSWNIHTDTVKCFMVDHGCEVQIFFK